MRFGIVVFPGSNCDHDCHHVIEKILGQDVALIFHKETSLPALDAVILPGGFSYGDYLRTGAIARFSPVMTSILKFIGGGGLVLGICNGFQILLEAGVLPGAMRRNRNLRFLCQDVYLRCENRSTPFTHAIPSGKLLKLPIAHMEGNYFADPATAADLRRKERVAFRYVSAKGDLDETGNPNGSFEAIAGILGPGGNVLGLMPHPERAADALLGGEDGRLIFESMVSWFEAKGKRGTLNSPRGKPS